MLCKGAGGGGTQVQRGAAPALHNLRKKGSFLRPLHVRDFVKEGYYFVPRYEVWGGAKLQYVFPFIQCQCFDKRRGVYLLEKVSVFIKIRVIFWPVISALGVF